MDGRAELYPNFIWMFRTFLTLHGPLEEVFQNAHLNGGVNIDGETLTDLRFADDVALISTSIKYLEEKLTGLTGKQNYWIGHMHKEKTKYMSLTNYDTEENIEIARESD